MRVGLQTDVSRGQDEGQGGEDDRVQAADGGQQVGPADAALSQRVAVRVHANCSHLLVGPAAREGGAADYHADGCNRNRSPLLVKTGIKNVLIRPGVQGLNHTHTLCRIYEFK